MKPIASVDPNFAIPASNLSDGFVFYPIKGNSSLIAGIISNEDCFRRIPQDTASSVSDGVYELHFHTAGGRIRFCTNSRRVAMATQLNHVCKMPHFAFSGSTGFDLYERINGKQIFIGAAIPPLEVTTGFDCVWDLGSNKLHELTLHLPLYSGVDKLYIGLDEGAELSAAPDYTYAKPVVYYGSSITQGGCASRPGNAYPNQLSLMLDCDHINLGFSGSAKAEDVMADYISKLDMSVFVYDYDHNAPDAEYLASTHERLFRTVRLAQPNLPVVMMSMPRCRPRDAEAQKQRFHVIQQTYENAIAAGDKNVYLIPGAELLGDCAEIATVDNSHPNDLGFYLMAQKLAPLLRELLQK